MHPLITVVGQNQSVKTDNFLGLATPSDGEQRQHGRADDTFLAFAFRPNTSGHASPRNSRGSTARDGTRTVSSEQRYDEALDTFGTTPMMTAAQAALRLLQSLFRREGPLTHRRSPFLLSGTSSHKVSATMLQVTTMAPVNPLGGGLDASSTACFDSSPHHQRKREAMLRKLTVMLFAVPALLLLGSGPAFAGTNGPLSETAGSSAKFYHTSTNGEYFRICDNRADGDSVYVEFYYDGSGGEIRLNWTGGNGTCVNRYYAIGEGKVVHYRSCVDDSFNDTCARDYVTGIA